MEQSAFAHRELKVPFATLVKENFLHHQDNHKDLTIFSQGLHPTDCDEINFYQAGKPFIQDFTSMKSLYQGALGNSQILSYKVAIDEFEPLVGKNLEHFTDLMLRASSQQYRSCEQAHKTLERYKTPTHADIAHRLQTQSSTLKNLTLSGGLATVEDIDPQRVADTILDLAGSQAQFVQHAATTVQAFQQIQQIQPESPIVGSITDQFNYHEKKDGLDNFYSLFEALTSDNMGLFTQKRARLLTALLGSPFFGQQGKEDIKAYFDELAFEKVSFSFQQTLLEHVKKQLAHNVLSEVVEEFDIRKVLEIPFGDLDTLSRLESVFENRKSIFEALVRYWINGISESLHKPTVALVDVEIKLLDILCRCPTLDAIVAYLNGALARGGRSIDQVDIAHLGTLLSIVYFQELLESFIAHRCEIVDNLKNKLNWSGEPHQHYIVHTLEEQFVQAQRYSQRLKELRQEYSEKFNNSHGLS